MEKPNNYWSYIIVGLVGVLLGMGLMDLIQRDGIDTKTARQPDTAYNQVKLDSITVQIGKHDTTLYHLNIKHKDDVKKVYQLNDSATVDLFKQLVQSEASIQ